jgi:hypothetical protein
VLKALAIAWDDSQSRSLREDVAGWASLIISKGASRWSADDVPLLQSFHERFSRDNGHVRANAYASAIDRVIAPFIIFPPPWLRTLLAAVVINMVTFVLIRVRPNAEAIGKTGEAIHKWIPILTYFGLTAASGTVNVFEVWYLNIPLLLLILFGEIALLVAGAAISRRLFFLVAEIEPLNLISLRMIMWSPKRRRRIFGNYLASVGNQLQRNREGANGERYVIAAGNVRSFSNCTPNRESNPAAAIVAFLLSPTEVAARVLIEAPPGRGKSALLREVTLCILDRFKTNGCRVPLPVLLPITKGSIAESVARGMIAASVPRHVAALLLRRNWAMGIIDGITERGLDDATLEEMLQDGPSQSTALLVSSRPSQRNVRHCIEGAARWLHVEPTSLDDDELGVFISNYGSGTLSATLRTACKGPDGYLPLLVRMAMKLQDTDGGDWTISDIYRQYFFEAVRYDAVTDSEKAALLQEASKWCLDTYWRNSLRTVNYEATSLQERLKRHGLLVSADPLEPPKRVRFFHDSMQTYLTAYGLALEDERAYSLLPRPDGIQAPVTWDRSRVFLWVAAGPVFSDESAGAGLPSGLEMFGMCLQTYDQRTAYFSNWLRDEILQLGSRYNQDLRRRDICAIIPNDISPEFGGDDGAATVLIAATTAASALGENGVAALGKLYYGIARLVYEYEIARTVDEPAAA